MGENFWHIGNWLVGGWKSYVSFVRPFNVILVS